MSDARPITDPLRLRCRRQIYRVVFDTVYEGEAPDLRTVCERGAALGVAEDDLEKFGEIVLQQLRWLDEASIWRYHIDLAAFLAWRERCGQSSLEEVRQLAAAKLDSRDQTRDALLAAIQAQLPHLDRVLADVQSHWQTPDLFYRFYHQSFKVYYANDTTAMIVRELQALAPERPLNEWFLAIVADAESRRFTPDVNDRWVDEARPVIEALLHAKMFLELVVQVGHEPPPQDGFGIPSGWATVLYLYQLRY